MSIYGLLHTQAGLPVWASLPEFRLNHAPQAPVVRNVALVADGERTHLVAFDAQSGRTAGCIVATAGGELGLTPLGNAPFWTVTSGADHVELTGEAGRLVALPDGSLQAGGAGEARFTVFSSVACQCLDALQVGTWIQGSGKILDATVRRSPAPSLNLGGQNVDIAGLPGPFIPHREPYENGPLRQIHARGPEGRLHRLILFNPVICLAVYGDDSYYDMLRMALKSLHAFGLYGGAICIGSDRVRDDVARYVPPVFRKTWRHVPITRGEGLFARYRMLEWGLEGHQPVLYLDTDVVTNAPIRPLLARLAISQRVHVATEAWTARYGRAKPAELAKLEGGNWFGAWLLAQDPRFADQAPPFASSGIIGADTPGRLEVPFAMVRSLRETIDPALVEKWSDQALANYALQASGLGEYTLMNRYVDFARKASQAGPQRRGFLHFHAGIGAGRAKRIAMQTYIASLAATKPMEAAS